MLMAVNTGTIVLIIVSAIFLIFIFWFIGTMNTIRRMKVRIEQGKSGIDVALEKRFDLIKQQYQAVKGIMKFEAETLSNITKMRVPNSNSTNSERSEFDQQLTQAQKAINVTLENYPDLKTSNNMIQLQKSVANAEENLQASRRIFNSNVSIYNQKIISFPSSIVAGIISARKEDFFEITNEEKRETFEMEF